MDWGIPKSIYFRKSHIMLFCFKAVIFISLTIYIICQYVREWKVC